MAENCEESGSWLDALCGFAVGLTIGATVSLLYAPKSGKELRNDLGERLDDMKTRIDEVAKQVTEVTKARLAETRADLAQSVEVARASAAEREAELRQRMGME
ncbi:MAG: YtxH domain-containing protein [Armatimonadota bacterium]